MQKITVKISEVDIQYAEPDVVSFIKDKLRKAAIPIRKLTNEVSYGSLSVYRDFETCDHVYEWTPY